MIELNKGKSAQVDLKFLFKGIKSVHRSYFQWKQLDGQNLTVAFCFKPRSRYSQQGLIRKPQRSRRYVWMYYLIYISKHLTVEGCEIDHQKFKLNPKLYGSKEDRMSIIWNF